MPKIHKPTEDNRRQVQAMAGMGLRQSDICKVMGLSSKTLRLHYHREIETGGMIANAEVAQSLYNKAIGNGPAAVTAAIFWLKARAGWSDNPIFAQQQSEAELGTIDMESLSDEALEEIADARVIDYETGEELDAELLAG